MSKIITFIKNNKKKLFAVLIAFSAAAALTGIFFLSAFLAAYSGITVKVNTDQEYNQITGFGGSAAWTTQWLGSLADTATQDEVIEALYGKSGMNLSVYRYNIGGGSLELGGKIGYTNDVTATESFFISQNYTGAASFSDESNYDFSRDAGAISIMKAAIELGCINKVVLFVNSPHYLLTSSGLTNGKQEYQNNLPADNYQAFADYVLIISKHIYDTVIAGTDIKLYISPANEPQWRWGGGGATQEGCHYDPANLDAMMDVFYANLKQFNSKNNLDFHLEAFESGSYLIKHNKKYFDAAQGSPWLEAIDTLSLHSYHKSESSYHKARFASYAQSALGKNVAMTEFCDLSHGRDYSMDSAMYLARVMIRDLVSLQAVEWGWWLAVSSGDYDDGLVYWDYDKQTTQSIVTYSKRYYVMSQFSKYIQPNDIRVGVKAGNNISTITGVDIAAFAKPNGTVAIVIVNASKVSYKIKLKDYSSGTIITTDNKDSLAQSSLAGNTLKLKPYSVTTLLV